MKIRIAGIFFYDFLYLLACYAYFLEGAATAPAVSAVAAMLFGALAASNADVAGRRISLAVRLFAIASLLTAILGLFKVLPTAASIMLQALGLLSFAFEWRSLRTWPARAGIAALVVPAALCFPVPGVHTVVPADLSEYGAEGAGRIAAPNVTERTALVGELFRLTADRAEAAEEPPNGVELGASELSEEDFGDLFELPFDVPASLYRIENASTDPHALMKTLARWDATNEEEVIQGQTVMGVGTVAPDGSIGMVDDIEVYALAASRAKPKVFFVPVEAYEEVRSIDKELLVVPVARFEEVLYFLSQPVTFWPLRNFGLFCH